MAHIFCISGLATNMTGGQKKGPFVLDLSIMALVERKLSNVKHCLHFKIYGNS